MTNKEVNKSIGESCEIDPKKKDFNATVDSWVHGESTFDNVMNAYPSYLTNFPERIIEKICGIKLTK